MSVSPRTSRPTPFCRKPHEIHVELYGIIFLEWEFWGCSRPKRKTHRNRRRAIVPPKNVKSYMQQHPHTHTHTEIAVPRLLPSVLINQATRRSVHLCNFCSNRVYFQRWRETGGCDPARAPGSRCGRTRLMSEAPLRLLTAGGGSEVARCGQTHFHTGGRAAGADARRLVRVFKGRRLVKFGAFKRRGGGGRRGLCRGGQDQEPTFPIMQLRGVFLPAYITLSGFRKLR